MKQLHQLRANPALSILLIGNIILFVFTTLFLYNLRIRKLDVGDLLSESSKNQPQLHLLLPATHSTPEFCKTLLTSLLYGYSPVVINWGFKDRGREGRLAKIKGVHDFVKYNVTSPDDLVLMIDAFDIWIQQPPSVFLSKYLASPPRILIGADKKCWPFSEKCLGLPGSPLPSKIYGENTDTGTEAHPSAFRFNRPRYPNSGTILSPQSLLLPLYTSLLEEVTSRSNAHGDQQLFISAYSLENASPEVEPTMNVDFTSELFQVMTFSEADMIFMRGRTSLNEGEEERLVWNRVTGTLPSVLHFNGVEKRLLKTWWERMWWITGGEGSEEEREAARNWVKRKVRRGGVTDAKDGRWMGWGELGCDADESLWG